MFCLLNIVLTLLVINILDESFKIRIIIFLKSLIISKKGFKRDSFYPEGEVNRLLSLSFKNKYIKDIPNNVINSNRFSSVY